MKAICRAAIAAILLASTATWARDVTLQVHHFLPAGSAANTMFIMPWCEKIAKESNNRMKCQIYPSMQLGGTPGQLYDQVRDGVADVVWTLPGYTAGRFPLEEGFELPFMMRSTEGTSKALWDYVQQYPPNEFGDVKLLATHVHGPGVFHTTNKPIKTMADRKGMKVRAPMRQTNRLLGAFGQGADQQAFHRTLTCTEAANQHGASGAVDAVAFGPFGRGLLLLCKVAATGARTGFRRAGGDVDRVDHVTQDV